MSGIRTASEIRQEFIDFFVSRHDHVCVPSSPVVPHDDPTLLFANAGMNQFKDVFLGSGEREYRRAVNSQKCIRAGGKHNDLDDVGKDSYHHTFFEMLGNWSFGDYFKEDAIRWSWELLTEVWGLEKDRLHATVFGGDEGEGLPADEEAEELWKSVTDIDPSHVTRWGKKDNFWEMGEVGPCGPCTEIHYDFTEDCSGGALVNCDDERVIEIWNNVFIQFNRNEKGILSPLPAKHVDTGMGFERIVRVLQGKTSNYDIDLWIPIFLAIEQRSGAAAYGGKLDDAVDVAYRVIADHMRCLTFAITDGAVPSNEGRGYVLRRILRRAVRHARQTLGVRGVFLQALVPSVVEAMGEAFPEIAKHGERVAEIICEEEESFGRTLDRGLVLFDQAAKKASRNDSEELSAEDVFKLHDTYGFPIDLTEVMAEERGMTVDSAGYERLMEEARERARAGGGNGVGGEAAALPFSGDEAARLAHLNIGATDDSFKFAGKPITARIKAIWNGKDFDERTGSSETTHPCALIMNRTNYYGEMGGQVGDTGMVTDTNSGAVFEVVETRVFGGYVLHIGVCAKGRLHVGDRVELMVDSARRRPVMMNHTATHLLNWCLREVLGDHVDQKGSLVAPDRLRFDFSHQGSMKAEEAERIGKQMAFLIASDMEVYGEVVPLEDAKAIRGLRAVFGERYPDPVRVVSIGKRVGDLLSDPDNEEWMKYSIEFCGGTHVGRTGEIEACEVVAEEAVAKGVRRVIAVTGGKAVEARAAGHALMRRVQEVASADDESLFLALPTLVEEVESAVLPYAARLRLRDEVEILQERLKAYRKEQKKAGQTTVVAQAKAIADGLGDGKGGTGGGAGGAIVAELSGADAESLRSAMDVFRDRYPGRAVLLVSGDEEAGKVAIVARVPEEGIAKGLKAGDWVREVAKVCGGGGGGRADMAQAGGKEPGKVGEAILKGKEFARVILEGLG